MVLDLISDAWRVYQGGTGFIFEVPDGYSAADIQYSLEQDGITVNSLDLYSDQFMVTVPDEFASSTEKKLTAWGCDPTEVSFLL